MIPEWARWLPTLNAGLNTLATVLLVIGRRQALEKRIDAHKKTMVSAFGVSVLFLASYLVYHSMVGSVRFEHPGAIRVVYLGILLTHVVLAAVVPFAALRTLYLGWADRVEEHRWWARRTWPVWIYVSITGVVIYVMLYHYPGPAG